MSNSGILLSQRQMQSWIRPCVQIGPALDQVPARSESDAESERRHYRLDLLHGASPSCELQSGVVDGLSGAVRAAPARGCVHRELTTLRDGVIVLKIWQN
jgi:hypothetical protein